MAKKNPYRIELLVRPGAMLSDGQLERLVSAVRDVASVCFDEIPNYQCLVGSREELSDKVLAVARQADGRMVGFSSAVLLPVAGIGDVLHLGLTCVHPDARGASLTHKLMSRAVIQYLLMHRPFGRLWISNVACVLSSLGNVALHFEDVFPSPFLTRPSLAHLRIALAIDGQFRDKAYILRDAAFDEQAFVFRGSVRGTMFQKDRDDGRYHHRDSVLNGFYAERMSWNDGDEVLQVGYASLVAGIKYQLGLQRRRANSEMGTIGGHVEADLLDAQLTA